MNVESCKQVDSIKLLIDLSISDTEAHIQLHIHLFLSEGKCVTFLEISSQFHNSLFGQTAMFTTSTLKIG